MFKHVLAFAFVVALASPSLAEFLEETIKKTEEIYDRYNKGKEGDHFPENSLEVPYVGPKTKLPTPSVAAETAEVPVCNSPAVKDVIISAFDKMKNAKVEALLKAGPLTDGFPPTDKAFKEQWETTIANIKSWQIDVVNIRQALFDRENKIRNCAADFVYQNVPSLSSDPAIIALGAMLGTTPPQPGETFCYKRTEYTIELLLDKPGRFYVSWRCL